MLRVSVGSTFGDLKGERRILLDKVESALTMWVWKILFLMVKLRKCH